jgi:hypothetical protein
VSQRTFLQELDADLHAAFADSGMAESATYTPAAFGSSPVTARVFVDRAVNDAGNFDSRVTSRHVVVTVLLEDLEAAPREGDRLGLGSETFTVDATLALDESQARLLCKVGT